VLVPTDPDGARAYLQRVCAAARRGVWLCLPCNDAYADVLPVALRLGFTAHHCYKGELTLQLWTRADATNPTPPYGHHAVGASAIVVNSDGAVLGIKERFDRSGAWFVPGGHTDEGEDLVTTAVREAREETGVCRSLLQPLRVDPFNARIQAHCAGVDCLPLGIVGLHERHVPCVPPPGPESLPLSAEERARAAQALRFGPANLGVFVLCAARGRGGDLHPDPAEIAQAAWLSPEAFATGAHESVAAYVRALAAAGQLAAAAEWAKAAGEGGAAEKAAQPLAGLLQGVSVLSAPPRPQRPEGGPPESSSGGGAKVSPPPPNPVFFGSTFYSALPVSALVEAGIAQAPGTADWHVLSVAAETSHGASPSVAAAGKTVPQDRLRAKLPAGSALSGRLGWRLAVVGVGLAAAFAVGVIVGQRARKGQAARGARTV